MHRASWIALAATLGLTPSVAQAGGALSKVVGGMKVQSGQTGGSSSGSSGGSSGDASAHPPEWSADPQATGWYAPHRAYSPTPFMVSGPYATATTGPDVELYLGMQSVDDSDAAGIGSIRVSYDGVGLYLEDSHYVERIRTPTGMERLTMDVWSMGATWRAAQPGPGDDTAIWLRAGLAGASSEGLQLYGLAAGAEIAHNFNHSLGVDAGARVLAYEADIRGIEGRLGLAASVLRVSYRVMKFNVGPALRGPEVGVALRF